MLEFALAQILTVHPGRTTGGSLPQDPTNTAATPADAPSAAEDAPVVVEFSHVTKEYQLYANDRMRMLGTIGLPVAHETLRANNDVSFTIRKGESVAFLGRNGAGKSTILKMITGVVHPTSGDIAINGRVSAILELSAGFDRQLTGRENIYMRAQLWGLSKEETAAIEPSIIKFASLGQYIDQPMRTYSSGMRARLGFAFASSIKPDILIIDEALGVGDRRFKQKCNRRMRKLMQTDGATVLLVTHSLSAALNLCERGIVMDHGELVFDGPIAEAAKTYKKRMRGKKGKSGGKGGKNKGGKKGKRAAAAQGAGGSEAPAASDATDTPASTDTPDTPDTPASTDTPDTPASPEGARSDA